MNLKVFKFGGASIANLERIENLKNLLQRTTDHKVVTVISAMGKTTNRLESVFQALMKNKSNGIKQLDEVVTEHLLVASELGLKKAVVKRKLDKLVAEQLSLFDKDHLLRSYDQIISLGELFSTTLVNEYLKSSGMRSKWLDVRTVMVTDETYGEAKVHLKKFVQAARKQVKKISKDSQFIITQGFLGRNAKKFTTTLGREGSDYTAALFAYALEVEELTIWKDVEGILSADPSKFSNVEKINKLAYREAIEMTYYGAKVIHPKTIQPIQNKGIKLTVRSFLKPKTKGTLISDKAQASYPPIVVLQDDVHLMEIVRNDFSFIAEDHLSHIFSELNKNRIKACVMRNSAISFNICVTNVTKSKFKSFIKALGSDFQVDVTHDLQLITVRHYQENLVRNLIKNKTVLFEEKLDDTIQLVVKPSLVYK